MRTLLKQHSVTSFDRMAFGDEPRVRNSVCNIWNEVLRAPEGGGEGGGGGAASFTQDDVNRIVGERVAKMKQQLDAATAALSELDGIKAKLAAADEEREAAKLEAEMKGKTETERLQKQLEIATKKAETAQAEWTKRLAEADARASEATSKHHDYVKRSHIQSALVKAGLAKGADKAAVLAFSTEAQSELDENLEFKSVAVGGKSFAKLDEAAKHFLAENPYFAASSGGGSGNPRNALGGGAGTGSLEQHTSVEGLLGAGLAQRAQS